MKNSKVCNDDISLYVKGIVKPIFDKVPKETVKTHMMGGGVGVSLPSVALYSPHNYRLYFDFNRANFNPKQYIKPTLGGVGGVTVKGINNNNEWQINNFNGFNFRVKKEQIEVLNLKEHKKTYSIEISEKAESQIIEIIRQKDKECIEVMKEFIKIFGGKSDFKILKRTSENKIWGTDTINALPLKERFHNKILKKVYNEQNIEFTDPVLAVNHLVNSSVAEVVPSICQTLEIVAYGINPLRTVKSLIKCPADACRYKDLIQKLSDKERQELEEYLFKL